MPIATHWIWIIMVLACVVASILPDLDHPLHYYLHWGEHERFLMRYFTIAGLILVGSGIGLLITLVCRLTLTRFLG